MYICISSHTHIIMIANIHRSTEREPWLEGKNTRLHASYGHRTYIYRTYIGHIYIGIGRYKRVYILGI